MTGREIAAEESPRRPGDAPSLVASSEKFQNELGWEPRHAELSKIIETAWRWHTEHPRGFDG